MQGKINPLFYERDYTFINLLHVIDISIEKLDGMQDFQYRVTFKRLDLDDIEFYMNADQLENFKYKFRGIVL